MGLLTFRNEKMMVSLDACSGCVKELINPEDAFLTNWVLKDAQWGMAEGFAVEAVEQKENKLTVHCKGNTMDSRGLSLTIERSLSDNGYTENYIVKNEMKVEYFITQETFGIAFPFNCSVKNFSQEKNHICNAHVWCGGNVCWIYGKKVNDQRNKLIVNMTQGDISDYSISRDISRTKIAADYRGDIVLNPTPIVLESGSSKTYSFAYFFSDDDAELALSERPGFIHAYADQYTAFIGEKIHLFVQYKGKITASKVLCGTNEVETHLENGLLCFEAESETLGDRTFDIYVNEKHTFVRVHFIEPIDVLLEKRANFIAKNQQYLKNGSHLDGAYLIYDNIEKRLHFSEAFADYNAGRERIAMGIIVLKQLQKKKDDFLRASIEKHRLFVERELFDEKNAIVYNGLCNENDDRIFNYPWFSIYFKEWYVLTGEVKYIERAARCLIRFYKKTNCAEIAQNVEAYPIIALLLKAGLDELAEELKNDFLRSAENIVKTGTDSVISECTYVQEMPNVRSNNASQAYLLTKDPRFLTTARLQKNASEAFYALQPDYHMNCIAVRHWDRFWFGKRRQYGDLFPHYWSALMGEMYWWYDKASSDDHRNVIEKILKNNLCVYQEDGSASNNYLYPYKINVFSSVPNPDSGLGPTGYFYGKKYDEWANDQDWALYLAMRYLTE